jgi:hypothetical protein
MGREARSVKSLIFGFLLPVANENGNVRVLFCHPRDGMAELCEQWLCHSGFNGRPPACLIQGRSW